MHSKLLHIALALSLITIFYNMAEGSVSVYFGLNDETLALFGFGTDSFVEVISGLGIAHMVMRMKRSGSTFHNRDNFERTALKITGTAFYLLALALIVGSIFILIEGSVPETTVIGIIVSSVSILTMYLLMHYKLKVGSKLKSDAIIADAHCTKACLYLSFILLASSGLYELFQIGYFDVAGSLGIAWFALREGRESWEKSRSDELACHC